MSFDPTDEQAAAVDLFRRGESMVIEAGAGAGKTSTLQLVAEDAAARGLHGRYLAFNKSIVTDVQGRLPRACPAMTAHSLAMRAVGRPYRHRLGGDRMKSWLIAQMLDVDPIAIMYGDQRKRLAPEYLAGHVIRAAQIFCQSADEEPSRRHFPYIDGIDPPTDAGIRTYDNNRLLAAELESALARAWADMRNPAGQLPFSHAQYLKIFQLSHPRASADFLLWDEAQDASPVMTAIIEEQTHCQVVFVGDENQAIYEWTGAVDALRKMRESGMATTMLTASFRFGPEIAGEANEWLALLGSDLRLRGLGDAGTIGELDDPDDAHAILCRTNAGAIRALLSAQRRGTSAHLVGGGDQVLSFARAAGQLQRGQPTAHPDLACFESWAEVKQYVDQDPQGSELRLLVALVEEFSVATIKKALEGMPREGETHLTISTAHKAKGRQWPVVMLDEDFAEIEMTDPELRLQYVAITRAQAHLDHSQLLGGPAVRPAPLPPVSGRPEPLAIAAGESSE